MSLPSALFLNELSEEWRRVLNGAEIQKKEVSHVPTSKFILRVVSTFLGSNNVEELSELDEELEESLVDMLSAGMKKKRRTLNIKGDSTIVEKQDPLAKVIADDTRGKLLESCEWMSPTLTEALHFKERDNSLGIPPMVIEIGEEERRQIKMREGGKKGPKLSDFVVSSDYPFDDHFFTPSFPLSLPYEVLDPKQVEREMKSYIKEVMDFLGIEDEDKALSLLLHFGWNKDTLIEQYVEDSEGTCNKCGVAYTTPTNRGKEEGEMECMICMDDYLPAKSFSLSCDHHFCSDCWKSYLHIKIDDGPACVLTNCMAPKCTIVVDRKYFKEMVDEDKFNKYLQFIRFSFVDNLRVKWCPSPGCKNCIRVEQKKLETAVECSCGYRYCFQCNDSEIGDHRPATCREVEEWIQKEEKETANLTWLLENTKSCPSCKSPIEKNGGCMHMTCHKNAGGCGHEFCWLCRGPWSQHGSHSGGYYACNKYEANKEKFDSINMSEKEKVKWYKFYYHRYTAHKEAMEIAREQRNKAKQLATLLLSSFPSLLFDDLLILLNNAAAQIFNNRQTLQWSYVYGYFLSMRPSSSLQNKDAEKNLFEYLQEDLEKYTNYLSEIYETQIQDLQTIEQVNVWKGKLKTYTKICLQFLNNLDEGISSGGLTNI